MSQRSQPVKVSILDKEYLVACPEEEREGLLASAALLDRRMREVRDTGKVVGADRVAVMAALNIAHDLLEARRGGGDGGSYDHDAVGSRIRALQDKIEVALNKGKQLEL